MKFIGNTVVTFLLLFIVVISMSCDDDTPTIADEYYVKYEIIGKSQYTNAYKYAQINFEDNTSASFNFNSTPWETTIGPVKKGFDAKIIGGYTSQTISNSYIDIKIYISKNNSPFALKKFDISDKTRTLVEMNYTIDF